MKLIPCGWTERCLIGSDSTPLPIYQVFQILGFSDNANHRMVISEEVITPMTSQDKEIVFYLADDVASVSVDGLF